MPCRPSRIKSTRWCGSALGFSRAQLCEALGINNVDKALRRLTKVGCIRSVRSKRYASYERFGGVQDRSRRLAHVGPWPTQPSGEKAAASTRALLSN